ncbi:MAG: hypothetical protein KJ970_07655 [Candidatus Eisenbacteria bacterium]|uniref:DUF1565 domain-containing protein n=1 Tax=Eiseniibacteriota bacterium TaxID=2212470 RepID=A0A948W668_UNCEI|nr:hypothetical protein [Candidatus Eisenbacteria bacterium]MBU1949136.1 hypothetical protein [Candidatus Eisenbacteria bacterium]MBU2690790.1 hypothetical protein [Candidatus Eisenbacteria bacterium]
MRFWTVSAFLIFLLVLGSTATPSIATIYVINPEGTGDYPTIQDAIDVAGNGDVIELTDGTFTGDGNRDINFLGLDLTVRSQSGDPHACIINSEGTSEDWHRAFFFSNGESSDSRIENLTVTGGYVSGID